MFPLTTVLQLRTQGQQDGISQPVNSECRLSFRKAEPISKRNSRKEDWRRGCGSKTEAYLFGFKKLTERETNFSLGSGASNILGDPQLDSNSVRGSTWTPVQGRDQNPATSSQERQQDNPCQGSIWKQLQSDVCERSGNSWKQVQGVENHLERKRLHFHNVQISDYLTFDRNYVLGLMYLTRRPMY